MDKKNPCDFGCLYRLVLRTDFNPDYLIFSRFYLKNRTTTKPTPKSLFFNDFNARRGIAIPNCNPMVNDGNYPVRVHKRERTNRATSSRPTTPLLSAQYLDLTSSPLQYNIRTCFLILAYHKEAVCVFVFHQKTF